MKNYSDSGLRAIKAKAEMIVYSRFSLSEEVFGASLWVEACERELKRRASICEANISLTRSYEDD